MGSKDYTNISKKALLKAVSTLVAEGNGLTIEHATKHFAKLKHPASPRAYPLDISHPRMERDIPQELMKWLQSHDICTKEHFDELLGLSKTK